MIQYKSFSCGQIVQFVVNMASLHFALGILGIVAALGFSLAQVVMVPTPMIIRQPSHPHQMGNLVQPVRIAEYKEPIEEERLLQRIKELEASKLALRQKQVDLDDKIAILHEEAVRCEKQINVNQEEIHKLEELERLHYFEQVRLERLIDQVRMAQYQEKLDQERLVEQREIEEMNLHKERYATSNKKDPNIAKDETSPNATYNVRMVENTSGTHAHKRYGNRSNEPVEDIQTWGTSERTYKNEPHSTEDLRRPKPSMLQETKSDLQPKIASRMEHVIEKKTVQNEPMLMKKDNYSEVVNEPKSLLQAGRATKSESGVSTRS